jgi:hypothetical protein
VRCRKFRNISSIFPINHLRILVGGSSVSCLVGYGFKPQSIYQINWQNVITFFNPSRPSKSRLLPPSTSISVQCTLSSYYWFYITCVTISSLAKSFKNKQVITSSFHFHFSPVHTFFLPLILYNRCNHIESGKSFKNNTEIWS